MPQLITPAPGGCLHSAGHPLQPTPQSFVQPVSDARIRRASLTLVHPPPASQQRSRLPGTAAAHTGRAVPAPSQQHKGCLDVPAATFEISSYREGGRQPSRCIGRRVTGIESPCSVPGASRASLGRERTSIQDNRRTYIQAALRPARHSHLRVPCACARHVSARLRLCVLWNRGGRLRSQERSSAPGSRPDARSAPCTAPLCPALPWRTGRRAAGRSAGKNTFDWNGRS